MTGPVTMISDAIKAGIKRNTKLLEHVMGALDANLISDIDLSEEDRRIRFTYNEVRYIVYHSGRVTISNKERGVEIGGLDSAEAMKKLLGI